jgi:hypothetical protein
MAIPVLVTLTSLIVAGRTAYRLLKRDRAT